MCIILEVNWFCFCKELVAQEMRRKEEHVLIKGFNIYSIVNGKEIQSRLDICIHIADSLFCIVETNNIIKQLYANKTILKIKKKNN